LKLAIVNHILKIELEYGRYAYTDSVKIDLNRVDCIKLSECTHVKMINVSTDRKTYTRVIRQITIQDGVADVKFELYE